SGVQTLTRLIMSDCTFILLIMRTLTNLFRYRAMIWQLRKLPRRSSAPAAASHRDVFDICRKIARFLPRPRRSFAPPARLPSCHNGTARSGAPVNTITSTDVIVVGAGAVGASCAYHLARAGFSVLVAEAFGGPAEGSTGRSFASIRSQWADSLNIEMSWRSVRAYRSFPDNHGTDVGYRPTGYLLRIPDALWQAQLEAVDLQRAHGVPVDVLGLTAAARITPFAADGIAGATWGPADGVVDPHLVPGARSRRNIYATAPGALPDPVPMTIDLGTGMFVRSEGPRLLFGAARPDQPDGYDVSVDWPWMESVLTIGADR